MNIKIHPLDDRQLAALTELTTGLKKEQAVWISGYFQGWITGQNGSALVVSGNRSEKIQKTQSLTILYGTHTGKSLSIAKQLAEAVSQKGLNPTVVAMDEYKFKQITEEKNLAVIVSTHGYGDPPDMAEDFYNFITGKRAPKLTGLNFAVLALGDTSYKFFCKTGLDIRQSLENLGASELVPAVACDVDYEEDASRWVAGIAEKISTLNPEKNRAVEVPESQILPATAGYSKKNPFYATVLDKVRITGRDSDKEVYHMELSLKNSGLTYEPGDSVGILANNPTPLVEAILNKTGISAEEKITVKDEILTVKEALSCHFEITVLTRDVVQRYSDKTNNPALKKILQDEVALEELLFGYDVLDLLEQFVYKWTANEFFKVLRPFPPRLYSISSSREAVGDEVHLTVATVRYEKKGRKRLGACSTFLADSIDIDDKVPVYIEHNPGFKLPPNGAPLIMVGAGTGIAPYRAFMQQREAVGKKGNTWLFFGDRRFYSDFLYQTEWQKLLKGGFLEKMEVAFSRDQDKKIYVQHRLRENQKKIFEWLEKGAVFYLCGDMKNMAKDVNKTLLEIIRTQGGISEEKAGEYFKRLKKEKRYQADVY